MFYPIVSDKYCMDKKVLPPIRPEIDYDQTRIISTSAFEEYKKVEEIKWKKVIISFGSLSLLIIGFIFSFLIYEFTGSESNVSADLDYDQDKKVRNASLRVDNGDGLHLHENSRSPASVEKYYYHNTAPNDYLQYEYQDAPPANYDYSAYDDVPSQDEPIENTESASVGEVFEPQPSQEEGQFMVDPDVVQ